MPNVLTPYVFTKLRLLASFNPAPCRQTVLQDSDRPVTLKLVFSEIESAVTSLKKTGTDVTDAAPLLRSLTRSEHFIPFITTFLSQLPVLQEAP